MFSGFTFTGFFRWLRFKLLSREIILTGSCRRCGSCCQKLNLNIKRSWVSSARRFNDLVRDNADYERFKITGRDSHGFLEFACTWLQEDGTCGDYENRLRICRDFPDKRMFFMNGVLPAGCGYSVEHGVPFSELLERQMKKNSRAHFFQPFTDGR
jgi:hypothetical protein